MNEFDTSISQTLEAYQKAVFDKDVDALIRLYDSHVRVFDAWGAWSYEGAGNWRKVVCGWFSSLGDERVRVTVDEMQLFSGQELAVVTAILTYAGMSAEGQELRALQNRVTWTLRSGAEGWRIIHEHTSAPIGLEDQKAILRRAKMP